MIDWVSMRSNSIATAILLLLASGAAADSWLPFRDQRVVSPSGKTYAVVRSTEAGVTFELCLRREGAPALESEVAAGLHGPRGGGGGSIDRDPEDRVLCMGTLPQEPLVIRTTDSPAGVVLFEKYGNVGYGKSIAFVSARKGHVFAYSLRDLFGADVVEKFPATVSSIWWFRGFAVSESRGSVILVADGDRLIEVSLADGRISEPESTALLSGFREGTTEERNLCLEVAYRLKPEGLLPAASALASDEASPAGVRLRAAVGVKRAGGTPDADKLFLESVEKGRPAAVRRYAVIHLPEILGEKVIPLLRRLMRGAADNEVWGPCQDAFVSLGEKSVPTLIEMLLEEGESPDYRGGAAHVLGKIGSKESFDALLKAAAEAPAYVANAAVNAAIAIGSPDLGPRLAKILSSGSTQDGRIAMYFREHPAQYAEEPLRTALARAEPESIDRRTIQEALEALKGK